MNYFAEPDMLIWLIVPVGLGLLLLWGVRARRKSLHALGQPATLLRMLPAHLADRRRWSAACYLLGLVLWVIALAGPLLGSRLVEFKQKGVDAFIAVDCSLSMQAEDFKPNRMAHAKLLLGQLIDRLSTGRIGIIAFAGQAYVQCPLTIDSSAAKQTLEAIDVNSVPIPGTVIGDAIRTALKGLNVGEGGSRVLILLTDGEDHRSEPLEAAKEAARVGVKIYPIGIGTADGEPIPVFNAQGQRAGVKRDKKGEVVVSRTDEKLLLQIAQETGGDYFRASVTGDEVDRIAQALEALEKGDVKSQRIQRFENRYQWPLALGLFLWLVGLAIPEARHPRTSKAQNHKALWLLILGVCFPSLVHASEAQLKEGNRLFRKGNYPEALRKYNDALIDSPNSSVLKFNAGCAMYQMGNFAEAEKQFQETAELAVPALFRAAARYNQGNAQFRQGKWKEAIESYKESLRLNSNDEDAKYNLGVALDAQANPPPPPKPQPGSAKPDPKNSDPKQAKPKPGDMSKEDAERLLEAVGAGEPKKQHRAPKDGAKQNDEDW